MKTESVYVTVKIDIECPSDMTYSEVEELVNDMDYNFSIPVYHESKVIDMVGYFRGSEKDGQVFCDMITERIEKYEKRMPYDKGKLNN